MAIVMPAMPPTGDTLHVPAELLAAISNSPHSFLQPPVYLHNAAILAAKHLLDPLASEVVDIQSRRKDENRKKRKRSEHASHDAVLQLRQVYISGFGVDQVWEQGRRVLDAASEEVARELEYAADVCSGEAGFRQTNGDASADSADGGMAEVADQGNDSKLALSYLDEREDRDIDSARDSGEEDGMEEDDAEEDDVDEKEFEEEDMNQEGIEAPEQGYTSNNDRTQETYIRDPNGLNDGFFSIDDFNKQSQFLEQQDVRGDEDNPSDEDEVDWDADPLATPLATSQQKNEKRDRHDDGQDSDEESGPTFGDADLNAGDSEGDDDGMLQDRDLGDQMTGLANTNDIKYAEFFEPPPKKPSKTKRMRALPKTQPPKPILKDQDEVENDIQRAISDVRRDLFDSEEELSHDDADSDSDPDISRSKDLDIKNLSTHEKQRAEIAAEIRRLEAANVTKRDWTLSGEARAADRPMNSLLEEDLEFERAGKPVPVITAEVSEEIDQLIKRRIIAREFDEIVRRRPEAIGSASETRRGRVELDDSKPQQGLADVYEQEHLKSTDPGYVDRRSAATKKQHDEIKRLWKEVSSQLDLLSNLHFKPKRVEAEIKTVEDKPVISIEDARPVGAGGEESRLAPQEIYRPGEEGPVSGEVIRRSGAHVNKEELSREEKLRRRRREKERQKKAKGNNATVEAQKPARRDGKMSKKAEQEDILTQLKKGGVKVIGKKGEMEDLGKKKKSAHGVGPSGSALKL